MAGFCLRDKGMDEHEQTKGLSPSANPLTDSCSLQVRAGGMLGDSEHQRTLGIVGGFCAYMLHAPLPLRTQEVKTQAVLRRVRLAQ